MYKRVSATIVANVNTTSPASYIYICGARKKGISPIFMKIEFLTFLRSNTPFLKVFFFGKKFVILQL